LFRSPPIARELGSIPNQSSVFIRHTTTFAANVPIACCDPGITGYNILNVRWNSAVDATELMLGCQFAEAIASVGDDTNF
jgi:hypothetical protein